MRRLRDKQVGMRSEISTMYLGAQKHISVVEQGPELTPSADTTRDLTSEDSDTSQGIHSRS